MASLRPPDGVETIYCSISAAVLEITSKFMAGRGTEVHNPELCTAVVHADDSKAPVAATAPVAPAKAETCHTCKHRPTTNGKPYTNAITPRQPKTENKIRPEKFADAVTSQKSSSSEPSRILGA